MIATISIIIFMLIVSGIGYLVMRRHYGNLLDVATKRAQKSEQLKSVFIENISRTLRMPLNTIDDLCNTILSEMGAPSMFLPRQEFPLIRRKRLIWLLPMFILTLMFGMVGCNSDDEVDNEVTNEVYSGRVLYLWDSAGITVIQIEKAPYGTNAIHNGSVVAVASQDLQPVWEYLVGTQLNFTIISYKEMGKGFSNDDSIKYPTYLCEIQLCK